MSRKPPVDQTRIKWTDQDNEIVRSLWLAGASAGQIAAQLTNGATRNAVMGKINRAGLTRKPGKPRLVKVKPAKAKAVSLAKPVPKLVIEPTVEVNVFEHIEFTVPPGGVTLVQLTGFHCRYIAGPVDGLDTLYCGCEVVAGSSYCAQHANLMVGKGTYGERRATSGLNRRET